MRKLMWFAAFFWFSIMMAAYDIRFFDDYPKFLLTVIPMALLTYPVDCKEGE